MDESAECIFWTDKRWHKIQRVQNANGLIEYRVSKEVAKSEPTIFYHPNKEQDLYVGQVVEAFDDEGCARTYVLYTSDGNNYTAIPFARRYDWGDIGSLIQPVYAPYPLKDMVRRELTEAGFGFLPSDTPSMAHYDKEGRLHIEPVGNPLPSYIDVANPENAYDPENCGIIRYWGNKNGDKCELNDICEHLQEGFRKINGRVYFFGQYTIVGFDEDPEKGRFLISRFNAPKDFPLTLYPGRLSPPDNNTTDNYAAAVTAVGHYVSAEQFAIMFPQTQEDWAKCAINAHTKGKYNKSCYFARVPYYVIQSDDPTAGDVYAVSLASALAFFANDGISNACICRSVNTGLHIQLERDVKSLETMLVRYGPEHNLNRLDLSSDDDELVQVGALRGYGKRPAEQGGQKPKRQHFLLSSDDDSEVEITKVTSGQFATAFHDVSTISAADSRPAP